MDILPRVLIVDDNADLLAVFAIMLRDVARVTTANHGTAALGLFEEAKRDSDPFNLVILDLAMPDLSGFEVAQLIRVEDDNTPILFLTAYDADLESAPRAAKLNARLAKKPIESPQLRALVAELTR